MFNKTFVLDLLERSFWTFVQAFAALLLVDGVSNVNLDNLKIAATAGLLAVLKALVASHIGESGTAATLPGPNG